MLRDLIAWFDTRRARQQRWRADAHAGPDIQCKYGGPLTHPVSAGRDRLKGSQILENRARPPSPSPGATEQTTPRHASDLHRRAIADKFFNLLKFLHNQLNQCLSGTVSICLTEQLPLAIENLLFQR